MASILVIIPADKLQDKINSTIKPCKDLPIIYISLNKPKRSIEYIFKKKGIDTKKIFFIDCVTSENMGGDVLHIPPQRLDLLRVALNSFVNGIKGRKCLVVDALSTLLIYNDENKVAAFVKEITEYSSQNELDVTAFSPKTKGEELLNKIFNFFDKVSKR